MAEYTQAGRPMRVDTVLGEDVLLLNGFAGTEGLAALYGFTLDVVSLDPAVSAEDFLRSPVLVTLNAPGEKKRLIHGLARSLSQLGKRDELVFYRIQVVPWLWFLTLTRESRIYQELTVPDIIEQVIKHVGFSDFELRLTRSYPKRTYCVQYRETHYDFISRLAQEEGISFFFEHSEDKHLLVFSDDNGASRPADGAETVRFSISRDLEDSIWEMEREHSVRSGKVTIWDYDYLQPTLQLTASLGDGELEIYDYPGMYATLDDGERRARLLLEAEEAEAQIVRGEGNVRGLTPGYHFTLKEHFRRDVNGKYLVTAVRHEARAGDYRAWDQHAMLEYSNSFECIPHAVPFRPHRSTPRPIVHGAQSALVVGPAGEEVHVDKYGRVKVQFHWDRDGQRNENSSCWVRVASPWAGKGYGNVSIPRIGNEVMVSFEEGDPDRPIIIGSVYNADQMPPFTLPGAGIQQGIKSRSSKGGGGDNEITVTDTKGRELMNISAQHNQRTTVGNNQTNTISNNRTTSVAADDKESVGGNQEIEISADQTITVSGSQSLSVAGHRDVTVDGHQTHTIGGDDATEIGGSRTTSTGGPDELTVGAELTVNAGTEIQLIAASNWTGQAGGNLDIQAGAALTITAGASLTLSCGGSMISLTPGGIVIVAAGTVTVTGALVSIN